VEPVLAVDAERAASIGLSLADRLCLALGQRLGAEVWTADLAWGYAHGMKQIR
jgi:PIN domain nuclease of toxin-antitoxin system